MRSLTTVGLSAIHLIAVVSTKRRPRNKIKSGQYHTPVCVVISAAGYHYQVAPAWFNLAVRYKRLLQESPLLAKVADGYDVRPDNDTGALRLYDLNNQISYSIPSQWEQIERAFLEDPSGRSLSLADRAAAIDDDCLFSDAQPVVIRRGFIGGDLKHESAGA